jgi:hypothetical protein
MELNEALLEQLERYLTGQMSFKDAALFEQKIESDADIKAFLKLYESMDAFEEEENWPDLEIDKQEIKKVAQKFKAPDTLAFAEKVQKFHQDRNKKSTFVRRSLIVMTSIAAACLLFVFQFWPSDMTLESVYNKHSSWTELPSFSVKGNDINTQKIELETAFQSKNYAKVIVLADSIQSKTQTLLPNVMLYQGIAELEMNRYEGAIQTFTNLSNSNALDAHKGYWYIALVYAKQGKFPQFKQALKKIESNPTNYKYEEAVKILKSFE